MQTTTIYFHGDAAEYTGKQEMLYGKLAYEIRMIEGHLKGKAKWTYKAPSAK